MKKLLVCLALAASAAPAQQAGCRVPPENAIVIDAATGQVRRKPSRLKESSTVTVFLINKNPFLYKYKLSIEEKAIGEAALSAFLPGIVPLMADFVEKPAAPGKTSDQQATMAILGESNTGSACLKSFEAVTEPPKRALDTALGNVLAGLKKATSNQDENTANYKSAKEQLETQTLCVDLRRAAQRILQLSNPVPDGLAKGIEDLPRLAAELKGAIGAFRSGNPDCLKIPAIESAAKQNEQYADLVANLVTPNLTQRLTAIAAAWKPIADAREKVRSILNNEDAFVESKEIGPFDDPTEVTVTATGANAAGDKALNVSFKLAFGEARFHLSAGIAAAGIEPREYERVQSAKSDGTVETRVGRKESGNFRILPMVLLHGRLGEINNKLPVYATVGITAKNDNKGTTPEYLVGLSVPLIRKLMFATVGAYVGRQQVLQGGLYEGAVVPEKIAELPVAKPYTCGLGFAISFKFR